MFKKVLAILLAVFLLAGALSVTVFADEEEPVTEISTVEDLYMINLDLAGNYKLMNDIDLTEVTAEGGDWDYNGRGWEPIGSDGIYSGETPFTGTFDGSGYEIKGLRIDVKTLPSGTGNAYVGLFANNAGTIKNLTVSGSITVSVTADCVGAIAGSNSGTIESCANYASVSASANYVGGICAVSNGTVLNCNNNAIISYGNYSGGICAYNNGEISDCYNEADISSKQCSGGICGSSQSETISDCFNNGNISVNSNAENGKAFSGGICGSNSSAVYNCFNTGSVTLLSKHQIKSGNAGGTLSDTATVYCGGICGSSSNDIIICYNTGEVSSSASSNVTNTYRSDNRFPTDPSTYAKASSYAYSGGICGKQTGGAIGNCYNTANISSSVEAESHYYNTYYYGGGYYCYDSSMSIGAKETAKYTGGIAGQTDGGINCCYNMGTATKAISDSTVTNCYFLNGSGADITGAKALSAAQMKLKAMYKGFDFDSTWFIDNTGEYPYPQLIDNADYPPEQPTEPVTETPTEIVTEVPTEPITEAPTEPATTAPTESETDAPTEAETAAPTEKKVHYLGDVDGDEEVTALDATYIQRYGIHVNVPYPIGEPIELFE